MHGKVCFAMITEVSVALAEGTLLYKYNGLLFSFVKHVICPSKGTRNV